MKWVLQNVRNHALFTNLKKCSFGQAQVDYMGQIISSSRVATDPSKTNAIRSWDTPTSVRELGILRLSRGSKDYLIG